MSESRKGGIERRRFLGMAAVGAAAGGLRPEIVLGGERRPPPASARVLQEAQEEELPPLGNGEPPATQFQAYPGGTGSLLEKLWKEAGRSPFERHEIEVGPWPGPAPTDPQEIAFLPAHRLGALIRERKITSGELTEIYLDRMKRYDPTLLCAVTILEERARAEAKRKPTRICGRGAGVGRCTGCRGA